MSFKNDMNVINLPNTTNVKDMENIKIISLSSNEQPPIHIVAVCVRQFNSRPVAREQLAT